MIVERTKLGMAKARKEGKSLGRPRAPRPPRAKVLELRREGSSWREVAAELGCSVWTARQAAKEPVKKGGRKSRRKVPKSKA